MALRRSGRRHRRGWRCHRRSPPRPRTSPRRWCSGWPRTLPRRHAPRRRPRRPGGLAGAACARGRGRRPGRGRGSPRGDRPGRLPGADRAAGDRAWVRDRRPAPIAGRGEGADPDRRRPPRGRSFGAGGRPPDRSAGEGHRHVARARALGGRLPGALRHPPGARRRPPPAHRPASRWARRGDGSHPRPRRARPGQRDPGSGGRAPAWLRAWRGRPHRRGHGRRLQALRARPPSCRIRRERDAACPAGGAAPGAAGRAAPRPACPGARPDRDLRAGHRLGRLDPARGRHGRGRGRRSACRKAPFALVRDPARRLRDARDQPANPAGTRAGSSASRR